MYALAVGLLVTVGKAPPKASAEPATASILTSAVLLAMLALAVKFLAFTVAAPT